MVEKKEFYDNLYSKKGQGAMRPQWVYDNWFANLLPVQSGQTLLDVGCGTGLFLKSAAGSGLKTTGLELSDSALALARQNSPTSTLVQGEGEHLPFEDKSFDYVCCLGTLEHMADPDKGLAEMVRVAKDGARFFIVVPNDNYLFWKLKKIKKGTAQRDFEELKKLPEWISFFAKGGLEVAGRIKQDRYPSQELKIFAAKNPYRMLRRAIYKLIWLCMPLAYTYQFVFVFKKK